MRLFSPPNQGLVIVDVDAVKRPIGMTNFSLTPEDQIIIDGVDTSLANFKNLNYAVFGVSGQTIPHPETSIKDKIEESLITMSLCPSIDRIFFSLDDKTCWCIHRGYTFLNWIPLWINSPGRARFNHGVWTGDILSPRGWGSPSPDMLSLAIAEWVKCCGIAKKLMVNGRFLSWGEDVPEDVLNKKILFYGTSAKDEEAAQLAKVRFGTAAKLRYLTKAQIPWV